MAIHQRRRQDNFITIGEEGDRKKVAVDYMDAVDKAVRTVHDAWMGSVRPMKWPEKAMKTIESVDKRHKQYPYSQLLWGYYALDLGMVDVALARFNALARIPAARNDFPQACGEVAFILAAFYGEKESAKGWWELFMNRASAVDLPVALRARFAVEGDEAAKRVLGELCGGAESLQAEMDWLGKVESREWEEEWDEEMTVFERGRILQAPFY